MAHKLRNKSKTNKFVLNSHNKNNHLKGSSIPKLFNNYQFKSGIANNTDEQEYEINDIYSREDEPCYDNCMVGDVLEVEYTEDVSLGYEKSSNSREDIYTKVLPIQDECAICKLVFPIQCELIKHAQEVHPNGRAFKCRSCKTVFSKLKSIPLHFNAVHGSLPKNEVCEYCNRSFFTKSQLTKHKKAHSQERPFSCDQCDKNYKYSRNLLVHKKTHKRHNSDIIKTVYSDNEYVINDTTEDEEENFTLTHNLEETSLVNEVDVNNCEYTYFIIDELNTDSEQNSELAEEGEVTFSDFTNVVNNVGESFMNTESIREIDQNECGVCFEMFNCQQAVAKHVHQQHPDIDIFKCPYCNDNFYQRETLSQHVKIHKNVQKRHVCEQCFKSFDRGSDLRRHLLTHSDERPFLCDVCNKGFKQRNHLKRHIEILHNKITMPLKYNCTVCPKKFNHPNGLKYHLKTHSRKEVYACSVCKQTFQNNLDLEKHEEIHNHSKRFACGYCSKCFDNNASLHRHYIVHSTERNFICSECGRDFKEKSHLKSHQRTHAKS